MPRSRALELLEGGTGHRLAAHPITLQRGRGPLAQGMADCVEGLAGVG